MVYTINRFNPNFNTGSWPLTVNAGDINGGATSLRIIGRSVPNYGQYIAENFLHLLENFAGPSEPNSPIAGQLWYNKTPTNNFGELRVYNGNQLNPSWNPISDPVGTMKAFPANISGNVNSSTRENLRQQGYLVCDGTPLNTQANPQYVELANILGANETPNIPPQFLGDPGIPQGINVVYIIKY